MLRIKRRLRQFAAAASNITLAAPWAEWVEMEQASRASDGAALVANPRRNESMKIPSTIIGAAVAATLSGCAGTSPTRIVGNTVGAAGGALLGHTLGKGDPLVTTLAAGGGALLSESLQAGSNAGARKSYDAGYEKGRSDAAKQQYQTLTGRQRLASQVEDAANVSLFDVPLPEREAHGVILAPSTATLRIQE